MTLTLWLSLTAVCTLGAMSPGPSLAVILGHTLNNGMRSGYCSALSHAAGVALWATLTILGLALLVTETPLLYSMVTYAGAAYLAWMGIRALRSGEDPGQSAIFDTKQSESSHVTAARDGFMISVLNPKLAIFFIALFSQFVSIHLSNIEQLAMITTAAVIDGLWYCIVVALVSQSWLIDKLQQRTTLLNKISGILFLALALRVVTL
jgi:threonine/homoserine/homoserine lactone efflux protein